MVSDDQPDAREGQAGMSSMLDGDVSHDRVTRFLAEREYTSRDLWRQVKSTVRQIEREDGVLIFDDTIQEKAWTDENAVMCWHNDHCSVRSVRSINLLNALTENFEFIVKKNKHFIAALKDNRLVALSEADKKQGTI